MTEYALIIGLLVAAIVAAFTIFKPQLQDIIRSVTGKVSSAVEK